MTFKLTPVRLGLLTAMFALQACNSSSDSDPALSAQAVDGYIVGAAVSCDAEPTGNGTTAAGAFTCPAGTSLMSIRGGQDVGFDPERTEGGTPFTGELVAPGGLAYVTPLSSLAVALARDEDGNYNPAAFERATAELAAVFGQSGLDLNSDPATTLQISQLNAQVHQVLAAFVASPENYGAAVKAFAAFVGKSAAAGLTFSLSGDVERIMGDINAELTTAGTGLAISPDQIAGIAAVVQAVNEKVAKAGAVDEIDRASKDAATELSALTLDRDETQVSFSSAGATTRTSIADFENKALANGSYRTVISTALTGLSYDRQFVKVNRNLSNVKASLGFQMKSTKSGDGRSLSYITHDARFTARKGNPGSLQVSLPENAKLHVTSVSRSGATRKITIVLEGDHAFTNDEGTIRVNNARVREELESRGIDDVLNANGNYEVTFAIGGLRVNSEKGGVARANGAHTIKAGSSTLAGTGVKGYVTVLDN